MTKTQLIAALAAEMDGTTKVAVKGFLGALASVAGKTLKKDAAFVLPGIAKLVLATTPARPERIARNPKDGTKMTVPAKPKGKKLKARFVKALKVTVGQIADTTTKAATPAKASPKKK